MLRTTLSSINETIFVVHAKFLQNLKHMSTCSTREWLLTDKTACSKSQFAPHVSHIALSGLLHFPALIFAIFSPP